MIDNNKALQLAKDALDRALQEKRMSQELIKSLGPAILDAITPSIEAMANNAKVSNEQILKAISGIKINVPETNVPEAKVTVTIPEIKVPTPQVTVNVPEIKIPPLESIKIPAIKVPKSEVTVNFDASRIKIPDVIMPDTMDVTGFIGFMGYDKGLLTNPLPVQIRDAKGNPVSFGTTSLGGGSSFPMAAFDQATQAIKVTGSFSISASNSSTQAIDSSGNPYSAANPFPVSATFSGATVITLINNDGLAYNSDNPLPVTGSFSSSPVLQVSGATDSVNVAMYGGNVVPSGLNETNNGVMRTVLMTDSISSVNVVSTVGLTDTQLRASTIDIKQVSGSMDSVNVQQFAGNTAVVGTGYQDNAQRVVNATDAVTSVNVVSSVAVVVTSITNTTATNIVDSSGVAYTASNPLPVTLSAETITLDQTTDSIAVRQVSGATDSVYVNNPVDNGDSATALRVVVAGNSASSVSATQVGTWGIQVQDGLASTITSHQFNTDFRGLDVYVGGIFSTVGTSLVDSSGVQYSTTNPMTVLVSDISASLKTALTDSSGVQYSGSNPVPVTLISGALTSVITVGTTLQGVADDGDAPQKVGGIARTTLQTAVADGQRVSSSYDKMGRSLVAYHARALTTSAYVQVSNGTETTLLAGVASTFQDMIWIVGANNSDAAVQVDIRSGTAGSVLLTLEIPGGGTAGAMYGADPLQQEIVAGAWTVDMPDITGTTVSLSAKFAKEL